MKLQLNMVHEISKIGGTKYFKKQLEKCKNRQPINKRYIFDLFIIYADCLEMDVDLKTAEDVIFQKEKIHYYLDYFNEIAKSHNCDAIDTCINIMTYNLKYVENLRLLIA